MLNNMGILQMWCSQWGEVYHLANKVNNTNEGQKDNNGSLSLLALKLWLRKSQEFEFKKYVCCHSTLNNNWFAGAQHNVATYT